MPDKTTLSNPQVNDDKRKTEDREIATILDKVRDLLSTGRGFVLDAPNNITNTLEFMRPLFIPMRI